MTTAIQEGFLRDGNGVLQTSTNAPSATHAGFLRDSSGNLVVSKNAGASIQGGVLRDASGAVVISQSAGVRVHGGLLLDSNGAVVVSTNAPVGYHNGFVKDASGALVVSSTGSVGSAYDSVVLADSPVAYWPLNETSGTVATDLTGNGYSGTYQGTAGTNYTLGQTGIGDGEGSVLFDGTAGWIKVSANPSTAVSNWTLEAWAQTTSAPSAAILWACNGIDSGSYGGWGGGLLGSGNDDFVYYGAGAFGTDAMHAFAIGSTLHHVVYTNVSGTWNIYQDGSLVTSSNPGTTLAPAGSLMTIGCQASGPSTFSRFWPGLIAKVAVYNVALTGTQVSAHYAAR
jgi:hypothetical protein